MANKKTLSDLKSWYLYSKLKIKQYEIDYNDTEGSIEIINWLLSIINTGEQDIKFLINRKGLEFLSKNLDPNKMHTYKGMSYLANNNRDEDLIINPTVFNLNALCKGNVSTLERIYQLYLENNIPFNIYDDALLNKNFDELNWWFDKFGLKVLEQILNIISSNFDSIAVFQWIVTKCQDNNIGIDNMIKNSENMIYNIASNKDLELINFMWDNRHLYGFFDTHTIYVILLITNNLETKSKYSLINIFDWFYDHRFEPEINLTMTTEINYASGYGYIDILNWFYSHKDFFGFKYSSSAIDNASMSGHIDCLKFWFEHYDEFELKYTSNAIDKMSRYHLPTDDHIKILDIWYNAYIELRIELKYTYRCLYPMGRTYYNTIDIWNWWYNKRHEFEFKYNSDIIYECLIRQITDVEWWFKIAVYDGFDLELDHNNLSFKNYGYLWIKKYPQLFCLDLDQKQIQIQ
jgi:hypothetical protein